MILRDRLSDFSTSITFSAKSRFYSQCVLNNPRCRILASHRAEQQRPKICLVTPSFAFQKRIIRRILESNLQTTSSSVVQQCLDCCSSWASRWYLNSSNSSHTVWTVWSDFSGPTTTHVEEHVILMQLSNPVRSGHTQPNMGVQAQMKTWTDAQWTKSADVTDSRTRLVMTYVVV